MISEQRISKVIPLVEEFLQQVTSAENDGNSNLWSAVRNNANNGWYVNAGNGNVNNNNANNRYVVVPCPLASAELLFSMLLEAERSCFKNKHHSLTACRVHFHLSELYRYARHIFENGLSVGRSKCFVLDYPVYREIFCAQYFDRIVHHLVAPFMCYVAEQQHRHCGDISHGNRTGHSAYTSALAVQKALRKVTENWTEPAWVAKQDYSGFFMSIDRQRAADMFRELASKYDEQFFTDIVCLYVMANPTIDCIRLSPMSLWENVAPNKSLFSAKEGHGLPIGNFPSQIIANLYRTGVDAEIGKIAGVEQVVFVDDRMLCSADKELLKQTLSFAESEAEKWGLKVSKKKRYFQQADKGVKFCGYVIKCDRIYISNRVIRACEYVINTYKGKTSNQQEAELSRSINSYFGLMAHARAYNIQKQIAKDVLAEHKTLQFVKRGSQLVCQQKKQYTSLYQSIQQINSFKKHGNRLLRQRTRHYRDEWHSFCGVAQNELQYEGRKIQ